MVSICRHVVGDVHRDSPNHADSKWQEDLEYFRKLPKDSTYFLGMGDYLDSTSTSERECLGQISKSMHETFKRDTKALQLAKIEMLAKEMDFMNGRTIGLINGNHYFEFDSGINGDQKLAEMLDCKYLGVCALIRVYFSEHGRQHSLDIFAHHGCGAARLIGGSINRVAQMFEGVEADKPSWGMTISAEVCRLHRDYFLKIIHATKNCESVNGNRGQSVPAHILRHSGLANPITTLMLAVCHRL